MEEKEKGKFFFKVGGESSMQRGVPDYLSFVEERIRAKRGETGTKEDEVYDEALNSACQQVLQILSRSDVDEDIKREVVIKFFKDFPQCPYSFNPELVKYLSNLTLMLEVSGPDSDLGIYVNGLYTSKRTPASVEAVRGDIIYVENIGKGAWVIRGDEEHIRFRKVATPEGTQLYADIVEEDKIVTNMVGYSLKDSITQEEFDRIVTSSETIRVLSLRDCWNIRSVNSLAGRSDLWALDLSKTRVTDLRGLTNLKSLKSLSLRGTRVVDISPVAELEELRHISLWETPVTDISPLAELKELRVVNLISTFVSDIRPLLNLKNIKVIYLTGSKLTLTQRGYKG